MLLSFLVVLGLFWLQQRQFLYSQARLYGETVLGNLVQAIELTDKDPSWVQAYVVAVGTSPGVRQLQLVDGQGILVAHTDPLRKGSRSTVALDHGAILHRITQEMSAREGDESFLRIVQPLDIATARKGNSGLAIIDIDMPPTGFLVSWMELSRFIFAFLGMLALVIIMIYFYLNRRVFRVIAGMGKGAEQFADGNFAERIPVVFADELGLLTQSFNRMAETLGNTMVSKEFFDNILRSMADALLVLDSRLHIVMVNPATVAMLGYDENELRGRPLADLVDDCDLLVAQGDVETLLRVLSDGAGIELVLVGKDAREVPVIFSGARISSESAAGAVVCVARDITERKSIEEEMRLVNLTLRAANQELKSTQSQLVQSAKMASLGEMAAGIAHELNQPLHIIGMSAELGTMALAADQSPAAVEKLAKISRQVKRAAAIINHLRTFARGDADEARAEHDLKQIINDSFTMFREQFRIAGIDVVQAVAEDLPTVFCNPIRLEQVLTNLLSNARDALVDAVEKRIMVRAWRDGGQVVLEIADSGHGIPESVREKIFDPFFTTKEVGKGTGLGLAISYGIIEEHGGVLEVESKAGHGTCFRIRLPAVSQGREAA
ncbi:MAG: ATP-binding protein [Desulfobulbaceae bacterium]|nr:ATP-binding protein [Desulfobulbaceae bacterium]